MSFRFQVYARETKNVQFGKRFQKFAFLVTVLIRYIVEVKNLNLLRSHAKTGYMCGRGLRYRYF